jgi:ubiquinone/menaquinone biosynthesis C-methylase UbiE
MLTDDEKNKRWSNYWEKGHVTSFGKGAPDNYKSDIKNFWFNQFESLDTGSTILDVAAGNGAVAMLAIEYSDSFSKKFTVLAADAAIVNDAINENGNTLSQLRNKVQFFSSTPCERLPFNDASIDLVCSQFGIEYSNLADSIPEVGRVLREGGKFAAIMHHHMSVTLIGARRDQSIIKEALNEHGVFDILRNYFIAIGETQNPAAIQVARQQPDARTQERILIGVVNHLKEKHPENRALETFLDSINRFTMDNISKLVAERLTNLEGLLGNYHAMIDRQDDLQNAAQSKETMIELQKLFINSKFKVCNYKENLNESSQVVGWNVNAKL